MVHFQRVIAVYGTIGSVVRRPGNSAVVVVGKDNKIVEIPGAKVEDHLLRLLVRARRRIGPRRYDLDLGSDILDDDVDRPAAERVIILDMAAE